VIQNSRLVGWQNLIVGFIANRIKKYRQGNNELCENGFGLGRIVSKNRQ
jgi:hypothetical protein